MPVSGLVLTLSENEAGVAAAVRSIEARPELTAGERTGRWLPVALEARDDEHSCEVHDWLAALPGVDFVDVVMVNFELSNCNED